MFLRGSADCYRIVRDGGGSGNSLAEAHMAKKKGTPAGKTTAPGPPAVGLRAGGVENLLPTLKLPRTSVPPPPPVATPTTNDLPGIRLTDDAHRPRV